MIVALLFYFHMLLKLQGNFPASFHPSRNFSFFLPLSIHISFVFFTRTHHVELLYIRLSSSYLDYPKYLEFHIRALNSTLTDYMREEKIHFISFEWEKPTKFDSAFVAEIIEWIFESHFNCVRQLSHYVSLAFCI